MSTITLELEGVDRVAQKLDGVRERLYGDLTPVWEYAHAAFMLEEEAEFKTQGAHFGQVWEPLSAAYAKRKPQPPPPYGILYRHGRLLNSLVQKDHPDHVMEMGRDYAVFGTRVPYGKWHQQGTDRLPQRSFVKVRETFRKLMVRALIGYALRGTVPAVPDLTGIGTTTDEGLA